jgi:hypothetical protein
MLSFLAKLSAAVVLLAALFAWNPGQKPLTRPGTVRILRFYASVGVVLTGESAELCYGVENAKSVRISPPVPGVYPSAGRCLQVEPEHTTHYTILAEGFDGKVAVQSLTLPVQTAPQAPAPAVHYAMAVYFPSVYFPSAAAMAFSASGPITSYPASLGCSPSQVSSLRSIPCSSSIAGQ